MEITGYREELKLKLTGNVLELELDDATLDSLINSSLREVQRYIDTTKLITIPYEPCIDMKEHHVNAVTHVYRSQGYGVGESEAGNQSYDPMYMGMWQMMSGNGNLYNINDWTYNYAAWNTALQTRNTLSTDMFFRYDKTDDKLYINCGFDHPEKVTVEFVPRFDDVSQVKSDFWIDMIVNVALAQAKITVGRIRSRFTQSNALWEQDTNILQEGLDELADLRDRMKSQTMLQYPID